MLDGDFVCHSRCSTHILWYHGSGIGLEATFGLMTLIGYPGHDGGCLEAINASLIDLGLAGDIGLKTGEPYQIRNHIILDVSICLYTIVWHRCKPRQSVFDRQKDAQRLPHSLRIEIEPKIPILVDFSDLFYVLPMHSKT